jgi:integrase
MDIKVVPHGFRSTFRDWASERTNHSHEVKEMALAHTVGSKVEAAYRRGDLFEKRIALMQDWADFINNIKLDAKVIDINTKRA